MADQPQYPTDEQLKAALDAYSSKGKQGLREYFEEARAKRAAEKAAPNESAPPPKS